MQNWFHAHPILTYLLILALTMYIFNAVFRVQRLPILKEVLVHLVMAVGAFVLFVLQYDKLPIVQCMSVAVIMMLMLRGRQLYDKLKAKRGSSSSDAGGA
ncbi:YlaH-like family protein [Paenibacillus sp. R14(2021)]|uniref:YlaH-like family protein n=1 Tax=Paenibacillus sp. R14(2021) TaxID=2859228 RepID=UPI001C616B45|nr:YlaH-like family protein [Paenibacillus sp. R14(2021)]